jgi:hypothetical protein
VILVDTCVLIDVVGPRTEWTAWAQRELWRWRERGALLTNPIVFAELCSVYPSLGATEAATEALTLRWSELPRPALFLASRAHLIYRRRGGQRAMVLPDFLIGAHAAVARLPLLTRDRRRFETYFPTLQIVAP